ncbi:glycine cleavage system aminomethyltransferase GcvT [Corynebacterium rhinophilum]|uniref:glycine cleavage system aminomethyltransferase GcvT n=1 Tax=Corynebacterium rhinophilum TaxID=3050197 RepID=UPI00254C012F|nr:MULTISPECIES: glycine cleavage system aminomethyltransferase GcvT [unclassified Corynebacterium]MDK8703251.1 glycine cleavage system aminomethyltransferase GcvT [Corynebacterium sp. MSK107]MDK8705385.1 glycine cleavage system aminomethyltransferase GcvT [Corynebacterium sp. MSK090]
MTELLTSPLNAKHEELGATFTAFGPWNMPLKYNSELEEHRAVRNSAGLFDLSHMGEIWVNGPDAGKFLSYSFISNLDSLKVGKAKYSMITAEDGGIIDDLISYRFEDDKFLVVPNAGNADTVWDELNKRSEGFDVELKNESRDVAMIAVQGPKAAEILVPLVEDNKQEAVYELGYYAATMGKVARTFAIIARTGYTGEDGFELIVYNSDAPQLWEELLKAGAEYDIKPCGLAARDSLRLEAGMPLYGNELSRDITPVEAGMSRAFAKKETDFVGADVIRKRAEEGPQVVISGLTSDQRRAARAGAEVYLNDTKVGTVTSGQPSPTLGHPVAIALLDTSAELEPGTAVEVEIRGKRYPFEVTALPFYKRDK